MKHLQMNDNLLDIVFKDCDKAISNNYEKIVSTYIFDDRELKITTKAYNCEHVSIDRLSNTSLYTNEQMREIYIYVIAELKQLAIREIRSGISDIVFTVESVASNPCYYKRLSYYIVKYGHEFGIDISVKLI